MFTQVWSVDENGKKGKSFERTIVFTQGQVILHEDTRYVYGKEKEVLKAFLESSYGTQLLNNLVYKEVFLTAEKFISKFRNIKR